MSSTTVDDAAGRKLVDRFLEYYRNYERDAIGKLAERYPRDQRALTIEYDTLFQAVPDVAEDWLDRPEGLRPYSIEALQAFDLPVPTEFEDATVRLVGLPEDATTYPGDYSPTTIAGTYVGVTGEISMASDVHPRIEEAAFECQRCGTHTPIPQTDGFQEPHECQGCERQGPFTINYDQSEFIDAQHVRIQKPPDVAGGAGREIDVYVERDLTDRVEVGDRVIINGVIHLQQRESGNKRSDRFREYLEGQAIEVETTDHTQLDIDPEERELIENIADGAEGDPLDVAAASLAPKIVGYDHIKRLAILQLVGGERVIYPDGSDERGDIHMLLLGDPGTAKSELVDRVETVAPRAVGVSGRGAREAGITAAAVRDDVGDSEWTLDPGAFVKANRGVVCIDELDDMDNEVRSALLEPMSKQYINVNKAGINAKLSTQAAVIAAGNPKYGRWDDHTAIQDQFDFESNLTSRFDVIYTLKDTPDPEQDREMAEYLTKSREAAKRIQAGIDVDDDARETVDPPIEPETLTKWIALAKQSDTPVFSDDSVREQLAESFANLRGAEGYEPDDPVPVTWRKLRGIERIAEAAAKLEFSAYIEERHVSIATEAVGKSMRDFGQNEAGEFDADVQETGTSRTRKERYKVLESIIKELEAEYENGVPREDIIERAEEEAGIAPERCEDDIETMATKKGWVYQPDPGKTIAWLGRN